MMRTEPLASERLSVLFLCTGNSARSQIAEALLIAKSNGRVRVGSAGVSPAPVVNPFAVETLRERGIEWTGRTPKIIDAVMDQPWDCVITVCDNAKESCPVFPGRPVFAHWGMPDPAQEAGTEAKREAFRLTAVLLARCIDLLLALPFETLERRAQEERLRAIAGAQPDAASSESMGA